MTAMEPARLPYADPLCIPLLHRAILASKHLPFKQHPQHEDVYKSSFIEASLPPEACPVTQFFSRIIPDSAWVQHMLATGHKLILLGPGEDLASVPGHPQSAIVTGNIRFARRFFNSNLTLLCVGPDGRINPLDETVMPLDTVLGSGATVSGAASTYAPPIVDLLSQEAYELENTALSDLSVEYSSAPWINRSLPHRGSEFKGFAGGTRAETRMYHKAQKHSRANIIAHNKGKDLTEPQQQEPESSKNAALATPLAPGSATSNTNERPDAHAATNQNSEAHLELSSRSTPNSTNMRRTKRSIEVRSARNVKPAYRGITISEAYPFHFKKLHKTVSNNPTVTPLWTCDLAIGLSFESLREPLWLDYNSYLPWLGWHHVRNLAQIMTAAESAPSDLDVEVLQRQISTTNNALEQRLVRNLLQALREARSAQLEPDFEVVQSEQRESQAANTTPEQGRMQDPPQAATATRSAPLEHDLEFVRGEHREIQTAYAMLEQGRSVVGRAVAEDVWDWGGAESGDCIVLSSTYTVHISSEGNESSRSMAARSITRNLFFHLNGVDIGGG